MIDRATTFVSTEWLAERLGDPSIAIVDASWYLPNANRDAAAEFGASHIPGAIYFDLDKVADTSSGLPHMLPSAEQFGATVGDLGISETQTIVVYDGAGLFSAPRVWWTFRVMGAKDVRILEGGFPKWTAEGRPVEAGATSPAPKVFHARLDAAQVRSIADMRRLVADRSVTIVDARPGERFRGEQAEPRAGLRSGHMPGSRNVPSGSLVSNGALKSGPEIAAAFAAAGVDPARPIVTSCGSGVTAAILALALGTIGAETVALYDGSWAEWGGAEEAPVVTGPAEQ
ncbi:3-mercaptopyruvate sulfurtransferase [Kaistia nematophila]|uniref:Sulfurtransferase n=1 Tax=Kaistia nematophila TaxID=2994654 RepID=A0A9X3IJN1_9HYPH|nr:3-mercaptopyruvate sulfurtransferase [Kaistia nematophila]MCX5568608.1 3-mercaptopyruvate sulfurtransferase [Kaistia nematophila]